MLSLFQRNGNTIVEAIGRNTLILVNNLPGVVEYLGKDYPLLYSNLMEVYGFLKDVSRVKAADEIWLNWINHGSVDVDLLKIW